MEINLCSLGTVGNTIRFDLCYLSAICIHKRLVFIILALFYVHSFLSLALPRHLLSVLLPSFCHTMSCELGGVKLAWPRGEHLSIEVPDILKRHTCLWISSVKARLIHFTLLSGLNTANSNRYTSTSWPQFPCFSSILICMFILEGGPSESHNICRQQPSEPLSQWSVVACQGTVQCEVGSDIRRSVQNAEQMKRCDNPVWHSGLSDLVSF